MGDRYGAAEDRDEFRKTERGERQECKSHKDGQGTWMKHQTTKMGT